MCLFMYLTSYTSNESFSTIFTCKVPYIQMFFDVIIEQFSMNKFFGASFNIADESKNLHVNLLHMRCDVSFNAKLWATYIASVFVIQVSLFVSTDCHVGCKFLVADAAWKLRINAAMRNNKLWFFCFKIFISKQYSLLQHLTVLTDVCDAFQSFQIIHLLIFDFVHRLEMFLISLINTEGIATNWAWPEYWIFLWFLYRFKSCGARHSIVLSTTDSDWLVDFFCDIFKFVVWVFFLIVQCHISWLEYLVFADSTLP